MSSLKQNETESRESKQNVASREAVITKDILSVQSSGTESHESKQNVTSREAVMTKGILSDQPSATRNSAIAVPKVQVRNENIELQEMIGNDVCETDERENDQRKIKCYEKILEVPHIGLLLACCASFLFSVNYMFVKLMRENILIICAYCGFGMSMDNIPVLVLNNLHPFPKGKRKQLLLRGLLGTGSLIAIYYSMNFIPIGEASMIIGTTPIFVGILARIFLQEPIKIAYVIIVFFTMIGITLISEPPFLFNQTEALGSSEQKFYGVMSAMCGAVFAAGVFVAVHLLKDLNFAVVQMSVSLTNFVGSTLLAILLSGNFCIPECGKNRYMTAFIMTACFCGGTLNCLSLQLEKPGSISIVRIFDSVFAFIWQILVFKDIPSWYRIFGAVIVAVCIFSEILRKIVISLPNTSRFKRILWLLTK